MKKYPLVSVIVPVYKVSNYIEDCLLSILNQDLNDLEVIVVNDSSPDNENDIIKKIQGKDSRIRLISHDINKGLGESRNTGCKHAQGKYLFFLDGDDLLPKSVLSDLCSVAELHDLDLVITDFHEFKDGDFVNINKKYPAREIFNEQFHKVNEVISWRNMVSNYDLIMPSIFSTTCPGKLFRRSLWQDLDCHVPSGLRMAEDFIPVKKYLFSSNRIVAYPISSILYRQRVLSATKKRGTNAFDIIRSYPYARKMFDEIIPDGELDDFIERFFVQVFLEHMFTFLVYRKWYSFYKQCAPYISSMNNDKLQKIFSDLSISGWSSGSLFGFYRIIRLYLSLRKKGVM